MKLDRSFKVCGIYQIYNRISGISYIGSGKSIYLRINFHFSALRGNRHNNEYLQNAFNKYGEEAFEVRVLEVCTLDNLKSREEFHILNTPNRYNFIDKPTGPLRLPTHNTERREIVRKKLTGRKRTKEQRQRFSESHLGHITSAETKQRQSIARLKYIEENKEVALDNLSKAGKLGIQKLLDRFKLEHPDGHRVEWVNKICIQCKNEFKLQPHLAAKRQYCSMQCKADSQKGKIPWNKGLKVTSNAN